MAVVQCVCTVLFVDVAPLSPKGVVVIQRWAFFFFAKARRERELLFHEAQLLMELPINLQLVCFMATSVVFLSAEKRQHTQ